MRPAWKAWTMALFGLAACADGGDRGIVEDAAVLDSGAPPADAEADAHADAGTDAGMDAPAPHDGGVIPSDDAVTIGPFTLQEGDEENVCTSVQLTNTVPMMVRAVRSTLTAGSHHMVAMRTSGPSTAGCGQFAVADGVLTIAEKQGLTEVIYPPGAGVRFEPGQWIALEMHYVNYSGGPLEVLGTVEFEMVPITEELDEVRFDFRGSMDLYLPANQPTVTTYTHTPEAGARIFALTSHTHSLGVEATIHRVRNGVAPSEANLVHRSLSWSEPPLTTFDPPIVLDAGERLLLTCNYVNTRNEPVYFGLEFDDEMCFMWIHWF